MADGTDFRFGFGSRLSLFAQDGLRRATDIISQSLERLSSGQRINSAVDDPASLSLASKLKADKGVYTKAVENVNEAITLNNLAYGGLASLEQIATRQVELATQAESEALTHAQRTALNDEANALVDEYNRIVESTNWNDLRPYDASLTRVSIQAGYGTAAAINLQYGPSLTRTIGALSFGTGTFSAPVCAWEISMGDINGDGSLDMVAGNWATGGANVFIGNGDGSFKSYVSYALGGETFGTALSDLDGDGDLDLVTSVIDVPGIYVAMGNGDGTFAAGVSYSMPTFAPKNIETGDLDGDGDIDLVTANKTATGKITVYKNNGDGTFASAMTYIAGGQTRRVRVGDLNGDGVLDAVTINYTSGPSLFIGNGDGSFRGQVTITGGDPGMDGTLGDFNGDGYLDIASVASGGIQVLLGNGDGTFKAKVTSYAASDAIAIDVGDFNSDGITDAVITNNSSNTISLHLGAGDGTFTSAGSWAVGIYPNAIAVGDVNNDNILDTVSADTSSGSLSVLTQAATSTTRIPRLSLMSSENAAVSADIADAVLARVTEELGVVNAQSSRLSTAVTNLQSVQLSFEAGYNRIMEVDVAEETAKLLGAQIVQNSAMAMLAQANLEMENVVELLKGAVGPQSGL